jgi:hypothetical protein
LFVGHEQDISIVEDYDRRSLHPMLLKCYHHLRLVVDCENRSIDQIIDEDYNLDNFEMIVSTSELVKQIG